MDPTCRRRLEAAGLQGSLEPHGATFRARVRDGRCVFLNESDLCGIHHTGKPEGCSQFPYLVVQTPEGAVVGASFYCPAVVENQGPPLADGLPTLPQRSPRVGFVPLDAGHGRSMTWSEYRDLEAGLEEALTAPDVALALLRRLEALAAWVLRLPPPEGPVEPSLAATRTYFLAVLVGSIESGRPAGAPDLTHALLRADHVRLERSGWEGDPARLLATIETAGPEWLDGQIRRYLGSLIFRKYPAADRPVLSNLTLLTLLPWLCRWYTHAAADLRGAPEPGFQDWQRAVEWLELRLVTHVTGMEPLLASMAEAIVRQVEAGKAAPVAARVPRRRRLPAVAAAAAALALGLGGSILWQSHAAPPPTVALVVAEPPGQGVDDRVRQALREAGAHATFLLDLPHLHDVRSLQDLVQEGNDVGANGVPEPELDEVRQALETAHVRLDTVHPRDPAEAPELEKHGFRVVASAGQPPEALTRAVRDGEVLVVTPGTGDLARLIRDLKGRGVRLVPLSELSGPH